MPHRVLAALAAALAFIVPLCSAASSAQLHSGDKIAVSVFNHPELSAITPPITIASDGNITLPVAGTVAAAGAVPSVVAARIRAALARSLRNPVVDVQVVGEGQSLFVSGGPGGVLTYQPGETLLAALGQLTIGPGVDLHRVVVQRNGESIGTYDVYGLRAAAQTGPVLSPGDELRLPSKPLTVLVNGAVAAPGYTYLDRSEPLSMALGEAGGATQDANTGAITLVRGGVRTVVAIGSEVFNEPAQPGDEIFVQRAPRVQVLGQVEKGGGEAVLRSDRSLLAALYLEGGPNRYGDLRHVQVMRQGARSTYDITRLAKGDMTQNPVLDDGDVVFIPEGNKIDFRGIFQALLYGRTALGWKAL